MRHGVRHAPTSACYRARPGARRRLVRLRGTEGHARAGHDHGHPGPDRINGKGGDDKIFGAGGGDRLLGGPGNDLLSGDAGNDVLNGGPAPTTCSAARATTRSTRCGPGDVAVGGDGRDVIRADDGARDRSNAGAGAIACSPIASTRSPATARTSGVDDGAFRPRGAGPLLVDDDAAIRRAVGAGLELEGFCVVRASVGGRRSRRTSPCARR